MSAGGTGGALKQGSAACGGGLFSPATPLGATIWPVGWSTTSRSFGAFATWARRSALRPPIFHLGLMHSRVLFCARKRGQGPEPRLFQQMGLGVTSGGQKNATSIKRVCESLQKKLNSPPYDMGFITPPPRAKSLSPNLNSIQTGREKGITDGE